MYLLLGAIYLPFHLYLRNNHHSLPRPPLERLELYPRILPHVFRCVAPQNNANVPKTENKNGEAKTFSQSLPTNHCMKSTEIKLTLRRLLEAQRTVVYQCLRLVLHQI